MTEQNRHAQCTFVRNRQVVKLFSNVQGRSGQGDHNYLGAESLWVRRMFAGGTEKSQQCHKYFFK